MSNLDGYELYRIIGVITFGLNLLSILGACYLVRAVYRKKGLDLYNRDFLVNDYVLYLSMWDVVYHVSLGLYWSSVGFNANYHWINRPYLCISLGFVAQLSLISSATWSFFIVINLSCLMNGVRDKDLKAKSLCTIGKLTVKHNHLIVWMVVLIVTMTPVRYYGPTTNPETKYGLQVYECWITDQRYQMTLYGPLAVYILSSACVFVWIGFRRCATFSQNNTKRKRLENRLLAFSVLFFIVYLFPTIERIWDLVVGNPPIVIVLLHHVLLSIIGFGNFLVWKYIFPLKTWDKQQSLLSAHASAISDITMSDTFGQLFNDGDVDMQLSQSSCSVQD